MTHVDAPSTSGRESRPGSLKCAAAQLGVDDVISGVRLDAEPDFLMDVEQLFAEVSFLAQLERLLRAHGRKRFPALTPYLDDLVNQTLQDLWRYAIRHPDHFQGLKPIGDKRYAGDAWNDVVRIALAILSRRAADQYRRGAVRWAEDGLSANNEEIVAAVHSDAPSMPRKLLLLQMLQVCLAELARSTAEEREILWLVIGEGNDREGPLSDAERQRWSRLKKRLASAIRNRLGESAKALLATELRDE